MQRTRLIPLALLAAALGPNAAASARSGSPHPRTHGRTSSARLTDLGEALPGRMPRSHDGRILVASPSGHGLSCTAKAPCPLAIAWSRARSGTIIDLRGGTYGLLDVEHRRFSPSNPVTMRSHRGSTAVFGGSSSNQPLNAAAFVDCQGIRITNVTFAAPHNVANLKIDTSQHMEINHVVSKNAGTSNPAGGNGILVASEPDYTRPYSDDVQIWNSTISNWGLNTIDHAGPHGIYYGAHGARNGVIANNVIYDGPTGFGLQLGGDATRTIVTNNTFVHMYQPKGGAGSAIVVWNDGHDLGTNDNVIVNNILSDNASYGIAAAGDPSHGNVVRNNLTYRNGLGGYLDRYGPSELFTVHGPGYRADPMFVDPGRHDYRLAARSPARRKATKAYAPPLDADGLPRPARPALGAFG